MWWMTWLLAVTSVLLTLARAECAEQHAGSASPSGAITLDCSTAPRCPRSRRRNLCHPAGHGPFCKARGQYLSGLQGDGDVARSCAGLSECFQHCSLMLGAETHLGSNVPGPELDRGNALEVQVKTAGLVAIGGGAKQQLGVTRSATSGRCGTTGNEPGLRRRQAKGFSTVWPPWYGPAPASGRGDPG